MKLYTLLIAALLTFNSTAILAQEDNNTVGISSYQYFGEKINPDNAINTTTFLKEMKSKDSIDVKLEAKILSVCKKKGCWMDLDLGNGNSMKVRFKDYEFFVPKDADGRMAVVEGRAKLETIDVATLKHYAQDAGKSEDEIAAITEPETAYSFEAFGVIIK